MSKLTKQDIINEIKRTTQENGGKPLGEIRFSNETGIKRYELRKYWARFGDAQKEAGFVPNTLTKAYDNDFIIRKMIGLIRKLGRFPVHGELRIEKNVDPDFPESGSLFDTKLQKRELARKISEWCKEKNEYQDITNYCKPFLYEQPEENTSNKSSEIFIGQVYLYKMPKFGPYYKIGKSKDTVRRGKELQIQLPENIVLIHAIETDDPSGVETYWHKRFEAKRTNGEWYKLSANEVKAFKRWRRIV
jgi:hypothetical protein